MKICFYCHPASLSSRNERYPLALSS